MKAAIGQLGKTEQGLTLPSCLLDMLFYRWGELNPAAANAAASTMFPTNFSSPRKSVITAWINTGGGIEAWKAVREESAMWACTRSVPGEIAEMIVASLANQSDAAAFKEVLRFDDENCLIADLLCRARAGKASATPESRAAFLAAAATHPNDYVINFARENLFHQWALRDAKEARAGAMAMGLANGYLDEVLREIDSVEREKARHAERKAAESP